MGQVAGKMRSSSEERVPYDEDSNNGYVFEDKYVPVELVLEMLTWVDYKTLLSCQLVCKNWNALIQKCVWKKKAEMSIGRSLPINDKAPWTMYYYICDKKFDRNLVKNHSGAKGLPKSSKSKKDYGWHIIDNGGNGWDVENSPVGAPELPDDPVFEGKSHCFVTSYGSALKFQTINLVQEKINQHFVDALKPIIKVSEYYGCRWDCAAVYRCTVELLTEDDEVLDRIDFQRQLEGEDQNQWFKFEHEFKDYGEGLRKIRYCHGGQDRQFWAGHYGCKMAGACVKLAIPEFAHSEDEAMGDSTDEKTDYLDIETESTST